MNREEQERKDECDEDDDLKSISSESSGEGIPISFGTKSQSIDEYRLDTRLEMSELESSLRALPSSDAVEAVVLSNSLQHEFQNIVQLNVALMFAVWHRNHEFTYRLLRQTADPNMMDLKGRSALHYACILGSVPITRILLHFKAKANIWDNESTVTPLHYAALSGSDGCMTQLIKSGAMVNAGIEKRSALHFAVQKNAIKVS